MLVQIGGAVQAEVIIVLMQTVTPPVPELVVQRHALIDPDILSRIEDPSAIVVVLSPDVLIDSVVVSCGRLSQERT